MSFREDSPGSTFRPKARPLFQYRYYRYKTVDSDMEPCKFIKYRKSLSQYLLISICKVTQRVISMIMIIAYMELLVNDGLVITKTSGLIFMQYMKLTCVLNFYINAFAFCLISLPGF